MTTIEAQVPEPVLEQARALAERERIPLAQLISLAVTQSVGVWSHEQSVRWKANAGLIQNLRTTLRLSSRQTRAARG